MNKIPWKALAVLAAGAFLGAAAVLVSNEMIHLTGTPEFCMSCHEMRVVGEQGWMESPHYQNDRGVVATCSDCHVPPGTFKMVWVKTRDGVWDIYSHIFRESDPMKMDWEHLKVSARSKIHEESCTRCHQNITPDGADLKMLEAHRENLRLPEKKTCLECHDEEFHGKFKEHLFGKNVAKRRGGEQ